MAARPSWPSMLIVPKPLHSPEKMSLTSCIERTLPNSPNSAVTSSSVADRGNPRIKSVINVVDPKLPSPTAQRPMVSGKTVVFPNGSGAPFQDGTN